MPILGVLVNVFAVIGAWSVIYYVWRNYLSPIPQCLPGFDKGNSVFSLPEHLFAPIVEALIRTDFAPSWDASTKFARRLMWRRYGIIINAESAGSKRMFGPGKTGAITRVCSNPVGHAEQFKNLLGVTDLPEGTKTWVVADFDDEIPEGAMAAVVIDDCPIVFIFRKPGIWMGKPPRFIEFIKNWSL